MEEFVGKLWHRLITGMGTTGYPGVAVSLDEVRATVGVVFRALGGDGGSRIQAAAATGWGRRTWLQRLGGDSGRVTLAWRDGETLYLPPTLALFPERGLNRDLYTWLAALAAGDGQGTPRAPWPVHPQRLVVRTLGRFPGLNALYWRLVDAQLALRPPLERLSPAEQAVEGAIRAALVEPGSVAEIPTPPRLPQPVHLWLHPFPPCAGPDDAHGLGEDPDGSESGLRQSPPESRGRHQARRVEMPDGRQGLLALRMETIFSWAEYVKVDRTTDEGLDDDTAQAADDLDHLSVARDHGSITRRLRLDLDLPAPQWDDLPLGGEVTLPEWDYHRRRLRPDWCRLQPLVARAAKPCELPVSLRSTARRLRGQFQALAQTRSWHRGQQDGVEPDLDAYLRHIAGRGAKAAEAEPGLYRDLRVGGRDLACLLLADLSLSTDAAVDDHSRVIDAIRDSLYLFAEALSACGDVFAMYGFSSRRREHVRFHALKGFKEAYDARVRGRIQAIKPGYYTRMGAAIRHATDLLAARPASRQLLLLLTDGKPNDLDRYEGRYGAEDTRQALAEARRRGLEPFCVTIDRAADDYLPRLFGRGGYVLVRSPADLPRKLPLLYARLTR